MHIRALVDDDVAVIVGACADWQELAQYGPPYWRPRSPAELRRKIAATAGPQPATEYSFVVEESDGRLVGECSLHAIDWRNRLAQIGVCIWNPADRRGGYGRAGVQHVISWGFGYLGLRRLEAWVVEGNNPSLELFKELGFAHEATLQGRYLHAGVRRAMHVLAISSSA
ncbi:GNAT family N-acetyltransferase [Mycobacterium sp. C31M]